MIGFSGTGSSFRGLANYLEKEHKMAFRETENLPGFDREMDIRLLEDTSELSNRIEKPVSHFALSYSPRDNPTQEMMIEDMNEVLKSLGLEDHQAVLVGHDDHEYKHIHAMVNRVCPGKDRAYNPWRDGKKIKNALKEIELERGYEEVSAKDIEKARAQASKGEIHWGRRIGSKPIQNRADIKAIFDNAESWGQLQDQLYEIGCEVQPKGGGGVVIDPSTRQQMKLSRVDPKQRSHSWGKLNDRFGDFHEWKKYKDQVLDAENIIKDKLGQDEKVFSHTNSADFRKALGDMARAEIGVGKVGVTAAKKALQSTLDNKMDHRGWTGRSVVRGLSIISKIPGPIGRAAGIATRMASTIQKGIEKGNSLGH